MEQNKKEQAKELAKTITEIEGENKVENMVKSNKIVFDIDKKNYRVRKPNYKEQEEADTYRRKKYLEYINDDTMLFRKQWVDKYKVKGKDINAMETKMKSLQAEIETMLLRLVKIGDAKEIEKMKNKILKIKEEQASINIEKTDLLSYSIEDKLLLEVNSYVTYLVLDKEIEKDKWEKVFKTYAEFMNSEENALINQAFYYINFLIFSQTM